MKKVKNKKRSKIAATPPAPAFAVKGRLVYPVTKDGTRSKRACGRISPKYPNETDLQRHVRLWYNLPDDAPVVFDDPIRPAEPAPKKEVKVEACPNPKPARDPGNLTPLVCPGGPPPAEPQGTKWKQVRLWVKTVSRHYEERGYYVTVAALCGLARRFDWAEWKRDKLIRRVRAIYQEDDQAERRTLQAMIDYRPPIAIKRFQTGAADSSGAESPETPRTRLRAFNRKHGAAGKAVYRAIRDTPRTRAKIRRVSGVKEVGPFLSDLIKAGLVVKAGVRYSRAPQEDVQCRSESTTRRSNKSSTPPPKKPKKSSKRSAKSARRTSSPSSAGSKSRARSSGRASSTAGSRRAKPGRSGRRATRKG